MLSTHLDSVQLLRIISKLLLNFCVGDADVRRYNIAFRVVRILHVRVIIR